MDTGGHRPNEHKFPWQQESARSIAFCFRSGQQENDSVRISPQVYIALSMLISFVRGWSQESDYSVFSRLILESIGPGLYIKQNKRTLRHLRDENVGQSLQ